jgi:hypothetical protein
MCCAEDRGSNHIMKGILRYSLNDNGILNLGKQHLESEQYASESSPYHDCLIGLIVM